MRLTAKKDKNPKQFWSSYRPTGGSGLSLLRSGCRASNGTRRGQRGPGGAQMAPGGDQQSCALALPHLPEEQPLSTSPFPAGTHQTFFLLRKESQPMGSDLKIHSISSAFPALESHTLRTNVLLWLYCSFFTGKSLFL